MIDHGHLSLGELIPEGEEVACCPIVLTEVMRGSRLERYDATRNMLRKATMIDAPTPLKRFEEAAQLYLECRIAGPTGGTPEKPVGTVHIAVSGPHGDQHRKLLWPAPRNMVKWFSTQAALDLLRRELLTRSDT